jgi:PadR family transcriptional regulator
VHRNESANDGSCVALDFRGASRISIFMQSVCMHGASHAAETCDSRMPTSILVGEFEQIVLLAVLRAGEEAMALRLREELLAATGRSVSRGAVYRTLDRLVAKGLLVWSLEPADRPERGGHPRRRFTVTPGGMAVLRAARGAVLRLSEGLEEILA